MERWFETDWSALFAMTMSLPEILIRGTLVYLALCLLLRVVLRRQLGKVALSDLVVITLVTAACRNPLVADAYSIPDGLLVVSVVLGWSYAMDWLSYYVPFVHVLLHSPPVPLVQEGHVLRENLRNELMTESQLHCQLRRHGVIDPMQVAAAFMESSGEVSVIKAQEPRENKEPPARVEVKPDRAPAASPPPAALAADRVWVSRVDTEVDHFLRAAAQLQEKLAWHQRQAEEHRKAIAEVKDVLAGYGFHPRARTRSSPPAGDSANGAP